VSISQDAIDSLARYQWPGNVRELSNLLERLSILYPHKVVHSQDLPERYRLHLRSSHLAEDSVGDLPDQTYATTHAPATLMHEDQALPPGGLNLKDHLSRLEVSLIREALLEADGGVAGAARLLQMRRTTLVEKMRKYRLSS
jgi:sigma-54 specific flagellar transcriptional regulator A